MAPPPPPPPLHEVFFCAGRLTLEPGVGLRFFKKVKWSELKIRNFWPGSRHLRPFPDRPDPISSLTELLSTHLRNWCLSHPHSLLNRHFSIVKKCHDTEKICVHLKTDSYGFILLVSWERVSNVKTLLLMYIVAKMLASFCICLVQFKI